MGTREEFQLTLDPVASEAAESSPLSDLLRRPATPSHTPPEAPVIGELVAIANEGTQPLIRYDGQPGTAALPARTIVDLHGAHIGKQVVLLFDGGDPSRPIIMGVIRGDANWPAESRPQNVEIDADGERLLVGAKEQLVLRCGKARITLTKAGKVLIEGSYVLSRSTGVNRLKGGSVQLN